MNELQETVKNYTNDYLLEQYLDHHQSYTPEAISILKKEMDLRGISQVNIDEHIKKKENVEAEKKPLDTKDFVAFDHTFSHTDILLATAILRGSEIIFYIDNPSSSDTIPLETEANKRFTIHVHTDHIDKTHELLEEHFDKDNGMYLLKNENPVERLKTFSFNDLHFNEFEAAEEIESSFTIDERRVIIHYGNRLLDEVDQIESEQERVVFYYDSIESLIQNMENKNCNKFSRTDLLTILEILQIYCKDKDFPSTMDEAITTLLSFFLE